MSLPFYWTHQLPAGNYSSESGVCECVGTETASLNEIVTILKRLKAQRHKNVRRNLNGQFSPNLDKMSTVASEPGATLM